MGGHDKEIMRLKVKVCRLCSFSRHFFDMAAPSRFLLGGGWTMGVHDKKMWILKLGFVVFALFPATPWYGSTIVLSHWEGGGGHDPKNWCWYRGEELAPGLFNCCQKVQPNDPPSNIICFQHNQNHLSTQKRGLLSKRFLLVWIFYFIISFFSYFLCMWEKKSRSFSKLNFTLSRFCELETFHKIKFAKWGILFHLKLY